MMVREEQRTLLYKTMHINLVRALGCTLNNKNVSS